MDELAQIQQQIADLQKKAQEIAQANRLPALEDVKNKIQLYGFTAAELGFSASTKRTMGDKIKKSGVVKYKLGENTWSGGRGRKPKWVEEYLATGKSIEDLAI